MKKYLYRNFNIRFNISLAEHLLVFHVSKIIQKYEIIRNNEYFYPLKRLLL